MKKKIKLIGIIAVIIITICASSVNAFDGGAMFKSLLTAIQLQNQVLYGETDYIAITDWMMGYYADTEQYDIVLEVTTNNIPDGTELNVTQEVYVGNDISTDILTFDVSGNTVESNVANIYMTIDGEMDTVDKIRVFVTYVINSQTGESETEYVDFEMNNHPDITINEITVESTDMPENVVQIINVPVETQDIVDGEILSVKLTQDGQDIDSSKYSVTGNSVLSNSANIIISAGPEITIGSYEVHITYEFDVGGVIGNVSKQSSFEIEHIEMNSIIIDQPAISLSPEESTIITYSVIPNVFTDDDLKFTSEDENVATITAGGRVTAVGRGQTTLTISSLDDRVSATCQVIVFEPAVEITEFVVTPEIIKQGEEATISMKIATVDLANGKALDVSIQKHGIDVTDCFYIEGNQIQNNEVNLTITPDATLAESGEYTILVTFDGKQIQSENMDKQVKTFKIQGNVVIEEITVDKESTRMIVGVTRQITATITPENADNPKLIWTSNNEDVAIVDENGLITANAIGTAVITVCADENPEIKKIINVTVQELVETEEYAIDTEAKIIKYIPENTTVEILMQNIRIGSDEYTLTSKKSDILTSTNLIGTDTTLSVEGEEYKLVVIGDIEGDGKVSITDVSKLKRHIVEIELLTGCSEIAADMNKDSAISPTDLGKIKRYLVGIDE